MSIANNDLFHVSAIGSCFGQLIMLTHAYNVLNVEVPGTSEATASTELLDLMRGGGGGDAFETLYRACLPPEYTLDRWVVQKTNPVRYRYYQVTRTVVGTHASSTRTANQSAGLTFGTLLGGRKERSTKHIGPIPEGVNVQTGGFIAAAYLAKLNALGAGMQTTLGGVGFVATWTPVIPHKTPAGSYTLISSYLPGLTVRVQRRRTVGLGK